MDGQEFLCLRFREKDFEDVPKEARATDEFPYYIVNYATPSNDRLVVRHFSEEKIKELIKKGKLKGEIRKRQHDDDVTVTSSSSELGEVISREGVGSLLEQDANDVLIFSKGPIGSD